MYALGLDPVASTPETLTRLLRLGRQGDQAAVDQVLPFVYKELRRLAATYLRGQSSSQTLQPTDLVHEAYLRLVDRSTANWKDRAHFFNLAAAIMRQILVDHARGKASQKRGGGPRAPLPPDFASNGFQNTLEYSDAKAAALVALDDAMRSLAMIDERKARTLELRYFGGLSVEETAEVLGVSVATVGRDTRYAEAWLRRELSENGEKGAAK